MTERGYRWFVESTAIRRCGRILIDLEGKVFRDGMEGKRKVEEFLTEKNITYRIFEFEESTHDAKSAADALGVELGQIAKTIVFLADGEPVVVVTCGDRRVNFKKLKKALGVKKVRFAAPDFVVERTGFAVGAVSPFGLPDDVRVLIDSTVKRFEKIYPAAGETNAMCEVSVSDLLALVREMVVDVSDDIQ